MLIDKCNKKIHSNNYFKEYGTYFSSVLIIKYYNYYATNGYSNGLANTICLKHYSCTIHKLIYFVF